MSNNSSFNELTKTSHAVWCDLAPEIDPSTWAWLCRRLGQLKADDFNTVRQQPEPKTMVRTLLKSWMKLQARPKKQPQSIPLVSIGPSGIGGLYQKEITLESRQIQSIRNTNFPRQSRIDLQA